MNHFLSTEIAVGNNTELVGRVLVNTKVPAALTFQMVTA